MLSSLPLDLARSIVEQVPTALNTASIWTGSDTDTTDFSGTFILGAATPTMNLSVSTATDSEAGKTVTTLMAIASSEVMGDQAVNLNVGGADITAGDYTPSNTITTIPNGATRSSFTFTAVDAVLIEGIAIANLSFSQPSAGITLDNTKNRSVSILDHDGNASLVSTITVLGNATDLFLAKGGR